MVESASKSRADIQTELIAYAEEQLAKWDSVPEVSSENGYVIRQDWIDGAPLTMVKWTCDDLEQKHAESWCDDPTQLFVLNSKNTYTRLDDDDGHIMAHVLIGTPMMVSNRAFVQTWYNKKGDDGSFIILSSSKYNEKFLEQHADKHGKAVIAKMNIQYTKVFPCEAGGYSMEMVS